MATDPLRAPSRPSRLVFLSIGWFAILVAMNAPHLGVNAALHWDALDCIGTNSPMPTAAQLAAARPHVFDLAAEAHSDDPAVVTAYFMSPAAAGRHGPLETVRRYYSQLSYAVARAAFWLGGRLTGSATGAMVGFQLAAAALVAAGLGGLTAAAGGRPMAVLAVAAVGTSPVFLSIARQVLTETVGFPLLVAVLPLAVGRRWPSAAAAGVVLFAAVRARYTMAVAAADLLPLAFLLAGRRPTVGRVLIGCATFAACVAVDVAVYGPFFSPSVYDDALVRSTRLYFHTDPPYDPFWTAMFVNAPLLVLPVLGVAAWWFAPRSGCPEGTLLGPSKSVPSGQPLRGARVYSTVILLLLAVPLTLAARQQVSYQPRHLFPLTVIAAVVLLTTVGRVRWRRWTAVPFAAACAATVGLNVYSTLGPQRTTMRDPWPTTVAQAFRHRWTTLGPHRPWPRVLLDGYFDWSDNTRARDQLLTLQYKQHTAGDPLLLVSAGVDGNGYYCRWATEYARPVIWWPATGDGDAAAVDAALAAGRPVLAVLPVGGSLPAYTTTPTGVPLDTAALVRVTGRRHAP